MKNNNVYSDDDLIFVNIGDLELHYEHEHSHVLESFAELLMDVVCDFRNNREPSYHIILDDTLSIDVNILEQPDGKEITLYLHNTCWSYDFIPESSDELQDLADAILAEIGD